MTNVSDVISLWPSPAAFAEAIGVRLTLVNVWRHRKTIPPEHWAAIEAAAAAAGIEGATASDMAKLIARSPQSAPEKPLGVPA